ncbi:MAG: hypothetical protein ACD_2C00173G0001 [uncultured bacterium (gcode 4)]|uniref:Uncharacterized protein n=1 Tax=uncultured bacterium (gcode 4) TaxID=1234023 RepID=K2H0U3_9BACT|nr:MAG: hypothetical protein ACD_2C00173G0001 [uncultured bacterium (gcode 4)]
MALRSDFPANHCVHIKIQEAVIDMDSSGTGYFPAVALNTFNHLSMLLISAKRVESRALADWEEKERNAIVAKIASITMTTISSTNVNAEWLIKDLE